MSRRRTCAIAALITVNVAATAVLTATNFQYMGDRIRHWIHPYPWEPMPDHFPDCGQGPDGFSPDDVKQGWMIDGMISAFETKSGDFVAFGRHCTLTLNRPT